MHLKFCVRRNAPSHWLPLKHSAERGDSTYIDIGDTISIGGISSALHIQQYLGNGIYLLDGGLPDTLVDETVTLIGANDIGQIYESTDPRLCISYRKRSPKSLEDVKVGFKCYPNPTTNYLIVENANIHSNISIVNITGQQQLKLYVTNSSFTIDLSKFQPGIYFIYDDEGNASKIMKL